VACAGAVAAIATGGTLRSADHGDSPAVRLDSRLDILDLYVFESPETPANTVMILTVCPFAGVTAPRQFAPGAKYQFPIDTNGDAVEDQVYSVVFSKPDSAGNQKYTLTGPGKLKVKGTTGDTVAVGETGKMFCGVRDDPFFFDLIGFRRGLAFSDTTSRNFFGDVNVMALVIEVPTASFGTLTNSTMGVWSRTLKGKKQIDRNGRPAINTVLVPGPSKDAFNFTKPKDDVEKWRETFIASLKAAPLSRSQGDAEALADVLLPDILTYDPTNSGGFLNGRKLEDDVIDAELNLLSNGAVTTDFVGNDNKFSSEFPYLSSPNP
jgi:hypothetical protein